MKTFRYNSMYRLSFLNSKKRDQMPQVEPTIETFARVKVIGVGGAGGAAINRMVEAGVSGVEFIAVILMPGIAFF